MPLKTLLEARFSSGEEIMRGSIPPVTTTPGQPLGQVRTFVPKGGELFEAVLS